MQKYYLILVFFLGVVHNLFAQTVTNVRVKQEGEQIVITYDVDDAAYISLQVIYGNEIEKYNPSGSYTPRTEDLNTNVIGDIGCVEAGRNKRIVWDVLASKKDFIYGNVSFKVISYSIYTGNKSLILAEYGYGFSPQHSAGITFGQCYGRSTIGWYVSVRTNLSLKQDDGLSCGQGGYLEDGTTFPFYSGNTKNNHIMANVGMLWDFLSIGVYPNYKSNMLALYVGVGYGLRYQLWETTDHQWVTYRPTVYKGVSSECGLIVSFKGFTLMAGVSTIDFKYMEVEAGIGWTIFHKRK